MVGFVKEPKGYKAALKRLRKVQWLFSEMKRLRVRWSEASASAYNAFSARYNAARERNDYREACEALDDVIDVLKRMVR